MPRRDVNTTKTGKAKRIPAVAAASAKSERARNMAAGKQDRQQTGDMTVSEKQPAKDAGNGEHNVDQIRDILFGGQMREYERKFQELTKRLEQESARLGGDLDRRITALENRLNEQLERLGKHLRQEAGERGTAVDELESRVLQAARTARTEVNAAINSVQDALDAATERNRKAVAEISAQLDSAARQASVELVTARDQLRHDKVDREDLAAYLTELSMRLRGEFELPVAKDVRRPHHV